MAAAGPKPDPIGAASVLSDGFRIDTDLEHAAREAQRVRSWLGALRQRHNLVPFEYTRHIQVVPGSATYSHPILTLGTRFTETEDHLLATYLHEQMHWYLSRLGGYDHDPIAPFFNELVRRYPRAPTRLPEGARNYEQTYAHIVVNWLEIEVTSQFIGWERARELANTQFGYRWIYRTVINDREPLRELLTSHGIWPMRPASELLKPIAAQAPAQKAKVGRTKAGGTRAGGTRAGRTKSGKPKSEKSRASSPKASPKVATKKAAKPLRKATPASPKSASAARRKKSATKPAPRSQIARRKPRARGGKSAG
jgi:hypothetical protein